MRGRYDTAKLALRDPAARDLLAELREIARRVDRETAVQVSFGRIGDPIVLIQPALPIEKLAPWEAASGCSMEVSEMLRRLREKNFLKGEWSVESGGVAAALLRVCSATQTGFDIHLGENEGTEPADALLGERGGRALVTCWSSAHLALTNFVDRSGHFTAEVIGRVTAGAVRVRWMGESVLECRIADLFGEAA